MRLAWHIARKDARLQRWLLIALLVAAAITMADQVITPHLSDPRQWRMVTPWWVPLGILGYALIWLVGIASVIQSDRLEGSTAFWLTRPISGEQLLTGKLLGLFVFVVVPRLIFDAIAMAAYRVSPGVILAALLQQAWLLAPLMLAIVFIATVTATVVRVLLVIAVVFTIQLVWAQIQMAIMLRRYHDGSFPAMVSVSVPFGYEDPNAIVLGGAFFAIGVLIAIAYQYRHRRRWPAVGLFVVAFVATWLLRGVCSHVPLLREPSVEQEPWARDVRARLRTVDRTSGRPLTPAMSPLGERTVLAAPVMLDGLPPGYSATPVMRQAALTFDDDHSRLELFDADRDPLEVSARTGRWGTLAAVNDDVRRVNGDRPATYTGTFEFVIERETPIATLPVAVGVTASDGTRSVTVSGTRFESSGCTLRLTITGVTLVTHAREWPDLVLRYQYRDGREMLDPYGPPRRTLQAFYSPRSTAGTTSLLRALTIMTRPAYPTLRDEAAQDTVHAACSDITMSVASVSYAGRLTRTLELHNFRLNDPFAGR